MNRRWTDEMDAELRRLYPTTTAPELARRFGVTVWSVRQHARRIGLRKTAQFMHEAQAHAAKRAKESHLRRGTYPAKGWYSPNLQKGQQYRFKRKEI